KPSTTLSEGQRAKLVQTGLNERIPVSQGGLREISLRIDQVNEQIKQEIAADPNRPIDPNKAMQNLDAVRSRFANQVNRKADVAAIDAAGQEFVEGYPGPIPAFKAQLIKQGTYRALGDKAYGELKGASIEAQKALARGLKDELAEQFPELKSLN